MKIAVTYDLSNGTVWGHFGKTENFKVYDVDEKEKKIINADVYDNGGASHGALVGVISQLGADALICGGIGGGARNMIDQAGIKVYPGVSGDADAAVQAFLDGKLDFDPNATCHEHDHHDHGDGGCTCH